IWFENEEAKKDLMQPSPDLWEPQTLYGIMNADEYIETIDISIFDNLPKSEDIDEVRLVAKTFLKQKAMYYYAISATREWSFGKHIVNIDFYLIKLLELDSNILNATIGDDSTESMEENFKDVLLQEDSEPMHVIFNVIQNELSTTDVTYQFDEKFLEVLLEEVLSRLEETKAGAIVKSSCKKAFELISASVFAATIDYEKVIGMLKGADPLIALAAVLKNPHFDDNFLNSLGVYRIPQSAARIAQIYFGAINGMIYLPGEYKKNLLLNRKIDELSAKAINNDKIPNLIYSEEEYRAQFDEKFFDGINIYEITHRVAIYIDEIREFFCTDNGKKALKLSVIQKEYGKKKICDWNKYKYFEVPENAKKGTRISARKFEEFLKTAKNAYSYDTEAFCKDMIEDKDNFAKLYNFKPEFWKELYRTKKKDVK
ncbi:MAG: hypothetical protein LUH07_04175, partial [Lachnospiraceae bacterium]|nr:hypothetical protein [Lachnospiraceae bacterium]